MASIGDYLSLFSRGLWGLSGIPAAPAAPTIAVVNDGDGDSVTVTVAGATGATHRVYYAQSGAAALTAGNSRTGDGDITQTGLTKNSTYIFLVVSTLNSLYSLPSGPVSLQVAEDAPVTETITDMLETGMEWLTSKNRAHRYRTVIYSRGGQTASVRAVVGRTLFDVPTEYGLTIEVEHRDYLIEVADLADFTEPQAGDRITDTLAGASEIFEVMAPGAEPVFRYANAYRKVFRVHTKHVGEAT